MTEAPSLFPHVAGFLFLTLGGGLFNMCVGSSLMPKRSLQLEAVALAKGKLQRPLTRIGVCLLIKWVIYGTNMIDPNIDEDFKTLECFFLMFIDVYVIWRLLGGIPTIKFKKIG